MICCKDVTTVSCNTVISARTDTSAVGRAVAGLPALARLHASARYVLAFSGGMDSTSLLHAMVSQRLPVRAVHVHHGMQARADQWQSHCREICRQYAVPFATCRVQPDVATHGPEAAARAARYAALRELMQPEDVLVTAQHADDQAETFILQALRGSGPAGLAGMAPVRAFEPGRIARPLLSVSRAQIEDYARAQQLHWCEDPSNQDTDIDRSFLRQCLWPQLTERWPQANRTLTRSARWCADAAALMAEWGAADWQACRGPADTTLAIPAVRQLGERRRSNALRCWLHARGLPTPDHRHLAQIGNIVDSESSDTKALVDWPGAQVRRYRDWLFASVPLPAVPTSYAVSWNPREPLQLPAGCGRLTSAAQPGIFAGIGSQQPTVRLRCGGERIRLPGRDHASMLKTLFQQAGVPPWVRDRMPLVYLDDRLVAVADLWFDASVAQAGGKGKQPLIWEEPPPGTELVHIVESR